MGTLIMRWIWQRVGSIQTIVWITLIGVALVVARGVAESVIDIDPSRMSMMVAIALVLGTLSAVAHIPRWLGTLAVASLGVEYLLIFWTSLRDPIFGMIATLTGFSGVPLMQHVNDTNEIFQALTARAVIWWSTLDNPTVYDPLVPQLIWGIGIWLAAVFLAWSVWKRYQSVIGILPFGILLGSAAFFTGELYEEMAFYFLLLILLQATSQGLWRQKRWINEKLDYATSLPTDLVLTVLPSAIAIVGVAYLVPSFSINKITQNVSDLFGWNYTRTDAVASSFGLRSSVNPFIERAGLSGLPRSHLLGNSPDLGRQTVMTIQTGEIASLPYEVEEALDIPQHYWQSAVYDQYTSRGWTLSPGEIQNYEPEVALQMPFGPGRELTQIVNRGPYAPDLLHTSGPPMSVDLPVEATLRASGDFIAATVAGSTYTAKSWVMEPTPSELVSASDNYPEDIARIYLRLPGNLPSRVRNLALDLTANQPTPYDKAVAIEQYLRQIPYNLEVEKPPSGADVADYFLFELQEGYCDYYATSMAILARSAGLPARFVIGYITGYYDQQQAYYHVSEAEAHSWVQIYFSDIGWVNFEPTGGRPQIIREEDEPTLPEFSSATGSRSLSEISAESSDSLFSFTLPNLSEVHPLWLILFVGIVGFVVVNIDFWRLRLMNAEKLSQTLYERLLKVAKKTGLAVHPGDTPFEFARRLINHIDSQIDQSRLARFRVQEFWRMEIHAVDEPTYRGVAQLARIFVQHRYAPADRYPLDRDDLLAIWEELDPELTRAIRVIQLTRRYPNWFKLSDELGPLNRFFQEDE